MNRLELENNRKRINALLEEIKKGVTIIEKLKEKIKSYKKENKQLKRENEKLKLEINKLSMSSFYDYTMADVVR